MVFPNALVPDSQFATKLPLPHAACNVLNPNSSKR